MEYPPGEHPTEVLDRPDLAPESLLPGDGRFGDSALGLILEQLQAYRHGAAVVTVSAWESMI